MRGSIPTGVVTLIAVAAVAAAVGIVDTLVVTAVATAFALLVGRFFAIRPARAPVNEPGATASLPGAAQSREIAILLDNVLEGFVLVDAKGQMSAYRSAPMSRWFGPSTKEAPLWSIFAEHDPNGAAYLELGWEALFDGFLPPEVALDQFPKRLQHGDSTFELVVRPIRGEDDAITSALVVLTDVTDAIRRNEVDATRVDLMALCERALLDKSGVVDFITEGDSILRLIQESERLIELKRAVHTLKGCAGQAGAAAIAACCEVVEDGMSVADNGQPRSRDIATLVARWRTLTAHLRTLFEKAASSVHVEQTDLDQLLGRIEAHASHVELARQAQLLRLEPMQIRLDRQKDAAQALAKRLGKEVSIEGSAGRLRSDPVVWAPFWCAFTHVVRNAIDHGIEPVEQRQKKGKPACATIRIDIVRSSSCVMIGASDDGGGIDWFKVAKKAVLHGLPAETPADLENALFFDGLSTLDEANDVSGRGIGMGAIRAVTESLGGTVSIDSRTGHGTTVRFTIPITALGDAYRDVPARAFAA